MPMQLFKIIPVQIIMDIRDTNDRFDLQRFQEHVVNDRYNKILILWGTQPLVDLLHWYQFTEYREGVSDIIKCLKDYSEEYYS